jgi:hypothetical protein
MSEFALVNRSNGRVADADIVKMTKALAQQLARFCAAWDFEVSIVAFYPAGTAPPETSWVIAFVDQPTVDGAEAFHTVEAGRPDGYVFAGYLLDNHAAVLAGPDSVAAAASHEVLELRRDPACTLWVEMPVMGPDGKQYARVAAEVCDPVQGGVDEYEVDGEKVTLSAWVTPSWEDPQDVAGPWSSDGSAQHAGHVVAGGYAVFESADGTPAQVMAEGVPDHVALLKRAAGRGARRARI